MNKTKLTLLTAILTLAALFAFSCSGDDEVKQGNVRKAPSSSSGIIIDILNAVQEPEKYTTKDSVAAYIHKFKKLPSNYVNKATGQSMYEEQEGDVFDKWNFNPLQVLGVMIGGDNFSNIEGLLPNGNYKECDVDYHDKSRGTKRLVYTNAGIVHYTANHYDTFTLIYGE